MFASVAITMFQNGLENIFQEFSRIFLEFSRICEKLFTYKLVNVATKSVPMYVDTEGSGAYKAQIGKIGRFDGARISTTWKK